MRLALKILLSVMLDSSSVQESLFTVLYIVGLWKLLEKSGIKGWLAAVPFVRDFQIARCAMREPEGRVYVMTDMGLKLLTVFLLMSGRENLAGRPEELVASDGMSTLLFIFVVTLGLVDLIYGARIYSGLIEVYGVKKRWIWLWLFPVTRFIPALLWGYQDKYQPLMQAEDIKAEMARLATHGRADVMDEGLTVNLKERSVWEFLQKIVLLRDIHLSIPQGHMVLLLGGSGAGKTTFVNAVNGYEKAKAEVMLNGKNMYTEYDKMQYEVGFVPQSDMMRGKDTVLYTLADAAKLRLPMDVDAKQRRARVDEVMNLMGLKSVQDNLVEKLSGGQRKRLSIAMELISSPSLLILDEPDSGLDGVMARGLFRQLRRLADSGKIVIAISHTPDRVIDLFDDVIVLAKDSARTGRLAWYGSVDGARRFFGKERMEDIVKAVNQREEGGEGRADEYVIRFAGVQNG